MAWVENREIPFSKSSRHTLHALADFQIGSESCNLEMIESKVEEIRKDKNAMVVIVGDIEDNDRPSTRSKRARTFSDRPEVLTSDGQKHLAWIDKHVIPILLPLAEMPIALVGVLAGHHWTQLTPVMNSVQYICSQLKAKVGKPIPYMGEMSGWIYLHFRGKTKAEDVTKLIHVQHGMGGGQTLASALNRLERTAQGFPADAYIRGHDCKLVAAKSVEVFPQMVNGIPELGHRDIALLNVGSATRGYNLTREAPDYVEAEMMRPLAMGWGCLHFDKRKAYKWEDMKQGMRVDIKIEL